MSNVLYDRLLRDLEERNLATERVMKDAATRHAAVDSVVDGAAGFSPALSPQIAVLSAQLLAQTKYLYPPMIEGLANIYDADPDDDTNSVAARVFPTKPWRRKPAATSWYSQPRTDCSERSARKCGRQSLASSAKSS